MPCGGKQNSDGRVVVVNRVAEKIGDKEQEHLKRGIRALYYLVIGASFGEVVVGVFEGGEVLGRADAQTESEDEGEGGKGGEFRVTSCELRVAGG